MRLPFWIRRLLLWCRRTFEELSRQKEALALFILDLPGFSLLRRFSPNELCYLRVMAGVIIVFQYIRHWYGGMLPLFIIGVFFDFIDGPHARSTNQVSEEGKVLDANADKVLVLIPLLLIGFDRLNAQLVTWLFVVECFLFLVGNYVKPVLREKYGIPLVSGSNGFGQTKMLLESIAVGIVMYDPTSTVTTGLGQVIIFSCICCGILSLIRHLYRMERGVYLDPRKRLITIPNLITLGSLFLFIPVGFAIAQKEWVTASIYIMLVFVSDTVDGWLARRYNWETYFGAALDPFRDFLVRAFLTGWMFVLLPPPARVALGAIILTEIVMAVLNISTSVRLHRLSGVTGLGKFRGFIHFVCLGILFLHFAGAYALPSWSIMTILFIMMGASLVGLISYVQNRSRLLEEKR